MSPEIEILTGLPAGTKDTGGRRADARPNDFDYLIATKGGRFWWHRAVMCPCEANSQTDQPDPSCTLCKGTGYYHVTPGRYVEGAVDVAGHAVEANDAQTAISVQAWISSVTYDTRVFERFGQWIYGTALLTTSRFNRVGYHDKFEARDQEINFSQLIKGNGSAEIKVTGNRSRAGLWTKIASVNILRSKTQDYLEGTHFRISDDGTIVWLVTPPTSGTLLSLHASFHPTWVMMEFPYAARDTLVQKKTSKLTVPEQFTQLAIRGMVKLDFLVET